MTTSWWPARARRDGRARSTCTTRSTAASSASTRRRGLLGQWAPGPDEPPDEGRAGHVRHPRQGHQEAAQPRTPWCGSPPRVYRELAGRPSAGHRAGAGRVRGPAAFARAARIRGMPRGDAGDGRRQRARAHALHAARGHPARGRARALPAHLDRQLGGAGHRHAAPGRRARAAAHPRPAGQHAGELGVRRAAHRRLRPRRRDLPRPHRPRREAKTSRHRRAAQRRHRAGRARRGADLRHGRRARPGGRHAGGGRGGAALRLPRVRQLARRGLDLPAGEGGPGPGGPGPAFDDRA